MCKKKSQLFLLVPNTSSLSNSEPLNRVQYNPPKTPVFPKPIASLESRRCAHTLAPQLSSAAIIAPPPWYSFYMTVQGIMQQLQSSPHQQGSLTGPGFAMEEAEEETDPLVEAGILICRI